MTSSKQATHIAAIALLLCIGGCSSGGGGYLGGTPDSGRTSVGSCTSAFASGNAACLGCLETSCNSAYSACLGSGWSRGSFSGACAPFLDCLCACPTGSTTCFTGCMSQATTTCQTCIAPASQCESANCRSACTVTSQSPDLAMTTPSPNCQLLNDCCSILTGSFQSICINAVTANNDNTCNTLYQQLATMGMCG